MVSRDTVFHQAIDAVRHSTNRPARRSVALRKATCGGGRRPQMAGFFHGRSRSLIRAHFTDAAASVFYRGTPGCPGESAQGSLPSGGGLPAEPPGEDSTLNPSFRFSLAPPSTFWNPWRMPAKRHPAAKRSAPEPSLSYPQWRAKAVGPRRKSQDRPRRLCGGRHDVSRGSNRAAAGRALS